MARTEHIPSSASPSGRPAADRQATDRQATDRQAFVLLRAAFTIAPILFGLDKFTQLLTDWEAYLAPWVAGVLPGSPHQIMLAVGVVEIVAGVLVAVRPDLGGYVVALWLAGIIVNLLTMGEFLDVALRDFGLLVGALALARLASGRTRPVAWRAQT
jgi:uncharacterized membrane protein YphA (DoxX/SURF4 family)